MLSSEIEIAITKILHEQNTWWTTNNVPETLLKPFKRRDFFILKDKLTENEILAIIGPRQVGKTTLMYQFIDYLISEKINPRNIIYCSFDYPYLTTITKTPINDILNIYSERILKSQLQNTDKVYIFFDEVCKLQNWSEVLKGWYDLKYNLKFIISDSSSAEVLKGSSESLVGRITPYILLSMKFIDVLRYFLKEQDYIINKANLDLREGLGNAIKNKDLNIFCETARNVYEILIPIENKIKIHLNEYLLKDGYPELLEMDLIKCKEKLKNYLSLTLYKDIVRIFEIRDPKALDDLVGLLATNSSQRVDYSSLSKTLSIKIDTLMKYLNYLESIFLISRTEFYSKSRSSRIRKSRKIYLNNVGLRNALLGFMNENLFQDNTEIGKVVETIVFDHCKRLKFCLDKDINAKLYYWKTEKDEEIDIIAEIFGNPIPIEVKYRNEIKDSELKGIKEFLKENGKFGIVVSKDIFEIRENIVFLPLWLFLMIC